MKYVTWAYKDRSVEQKRACKKQHRKKRSPVAAEREGVVLLPGRPSGSVVVAVALAETAVLLAFAGKTTRFAVLVDGLGDPVNASVTADLEA